MTHNSIEALKDPGNDLELLISYENLSLTLQVPVKTSSPVLNQGLIAPLYNAWINFTYHLLRNKSAKEPFHRIENATGLLQSGESTLIIALPGSGSSTLKKLLTLSLKPTSGTILFNGYTPLEAERELGVDLYKMIRYVDQVDSHFLQLTVWETMSFANKLSTKNPSEHYLLYLLDIFQLLECKHTMVGKCSGGQKRRLSLLLALCNPHTKVIAADHYTDGLDSYSSERITQFLTKWCVINRGILIATLEQPSPALIDQFSNIIVLHEGKMLFNGPKCDIFGFFEAMGLECPPTSDIASHICHVITDPIAYIREQIIIQQSQLPEVNRGGMDFTENATNFSKTLTYHRRKPIPTSLGPQLTPTITPCTNHDEMMVFYKTSPFYKHIEANLQSTYQLRQTQLFLTHKSSLDDNLSPNDQQSQITKNRDEVQKRDLESKPSSGIISTLPPLKTDATFDTYSLGYVAPVLVLIMYLLDRQLTLTWRNKSTMITKMINGLWVSIVFSVLYFQIDQSNYTLRVAALIDLLIEFGYNNLVEISLYLENRPLIHSQIRLFPTWIYLLSVQLTSVLPAMIEGLIFTVLPYSMIGHSGDAISIITYYLLFLIHGAALAALFRFGASLSTNMSMAYAFVGPAVSFFALCSGFYIRPTALPDFLIWLYYISPFAFALRALSLNEFKSSRYDQLIPNPNNPSIIQRAGDVYLELNGVTTDRAWILYSVIYCVGIIALLIVVTAFVLYDPFVEYSIGTRRFSNAEETASGKDEDDNRVFFDLIDEKNHLVEQQLFADDLDLLRHREEVQQEHDRLYDLMGRNNNNNNNNNNDHDDGDGGGGGGSRQHHHHHHHDFDDNDSDSDTKFTPIAAPAPVNCTDGDIELSTIQPVSRVSQHRPSVSMAQTHSRFAVGNNKLHTLTNELPFTPATLSFEDIEFVVKAKNDQGQMYDRCLLQKISGYVQSGTLLALMGSSGAGKSTLLNCLFGLNKTTATQTLSGKIKINGREVSPTEFNRLTGYCEQFSTLFPFDTVYETLSFSARMRLDASVTSEQIHAIVMEVIDILDLTNAKDLMIGTPQFPVLSQSQIKRTSIGLELVANPAILFLDEPTTGLSSESAYTVIKAISRIARSGRAIVCTIHQPSPSIFASFDSLLLLGSGGYPLYFNRLGFQGKTMTDYFTHQLSLSSFDLGGKAYQLIAPPPKNCNLAEWLIEHVSQANVYHGDSTEDAEAVLSFAEQQYYSFYNENPSLIPAYDNNGPQSGDVDRQSHKSLQPFHSLNHRHRFIRYLYIEYMKSLSHNKTLAFLNHINAKANQSPTLITVHEASKSDSTALDVDVSRQRRSISQGNLSDTPMIDKIPFFQQLLWVFARTWHCYARYAHLIYMRLLSSLITSLIYGLVYYNNSSLSPSLSTTITYVSATVQTVGIICFGFSSTGLPLYHQLKPIFYREQHAGYYSAILWPLALLFSEAVFLIPLTFAGFIIHVPMIVPDLTAAFFFQFWLIFYVVCIFFVQLAIALSLIVADRFAEILVNMHASMSYSFLGLGIPYPQTNKFCQFMMRILPFMYLNRAVSTMLFERSDDEYFDWYFAGINHVVSVKDFITDYFGFQYGNYWWSILWLSVMASVALVLALIGSRFVRTMY